MPRLAQAVDRTSGTGGRSPFGQGIASKFKERGKARLVIWDKKNEYRGLAKITDFDHFG